jgi:cytochrome c-type biogenesis protein CcmH/NrfG
MALLVLLGIWLLILFAVGKSAERRGRNPFPWVCLAAVFGIFAFIPLLAAGESRSGMLEIEAERQERLRRVAPVAPSQIKELAELKDAGLLTEHEYETKRADLLQRL